MLERLRRPEDNFNSDMWVDEAIWGHRIYDEQTPWLCFMEFLSVVDAELSDGRAFVEGVPNSLVYTPKKKLYLRNILFNNPRLLMVERKYQNDDRSRWDEWFYVMGKSQYGIIDQQEMFRYLEKRFPKFEDFVVVVEFLRSTTIEGENNKRWSSQFIFPYGPDCLYEDLRIQSKGEPSNDRRFFARTGELLYLMIARSGKGKEILSYLLESVLDRNNKFNKLVAALEPDQVKTSIVPVRGGYLPYLDLIDYEELANDWINIFRSKIPKYDAIPHLVNITGLHLIMYNLKRAKEILDEGEKPKFVVEILAPKKTIVRELSSESFIENNNLSRLAVEKFVRNVTEKNEWARVRESNTVSEAMSILRNEFAWPKESKEPELASIKNVDDLLQELVDSAIKRHKQHVDKFHSVWGKEIGLSSRRGTRKLRYAPHDFLMKSLVLTVVPKRMEYQEFLHQLYVRYGLIIGDKQATFMADNGRVDQEAFSDNAKRLEERLASMGLLKRLSDACAYVENPYGLQED